MIPAPLPEGEARRLAALVKTGLLDSAPETGFDDLVAVAAHICGVPISLVSLVDSHRQWFKARVGLDATETPRDVAFCAHAIHSDSLLVVPDALQDTRFYDNPLVTGGPLIRFYAGAPIHAPDGDRIGTLCVIDRVPRQLTDEQLEALARLGRQVEAQIALRAALADAQSLARARSNLMAIVAHELRTPLTAVKAALGLVLGGAAGDVPAALHPLLASAGENADRMTRLVTDFLDLAKHADAVQTGITTEPLDVDRLLERALASLRALATDRDVTLECQVDPDATVRGNADGLTQVVVNLVGNALAFSPPGGTVSIRARRQADEVRFEVEDWGPGIPTNALERVFGAFEQVEGAQRRGSRGTGMGLAISKAIVASHGGRIGVDSVVGEGSTFWFTVPTPAP